jgi:hypothetical protein
MKLLIANIIQEAREMYLNKSDDEQANNKVFTGLLTNKIHYMLSKRLTCIQVRKI